MCGRYGVPVSDFKTFGIKDSLPGFNGTYNATPGLFLPVLLKESPLRAQLMKWGLIPFWSKEPRVKFSTINARSETVVTSPAFREAFKKRRCLVPCIGFYEWQRHADGTKDPYYIHLKSRPMFAMAGIWDSWKDVEGKELRTFAIVTTTPNDLMAPIHTRMPVILPKEAEDVWTNASTPIDTLKSLMVPYDTSNMDAYRISTRVNNPENNDPRILEKV